MKAPTGEVLLAVRAFCEAENWVSAARKLGRGKCMEYGSEEYDGTGRLYAASGPCRTSWPDEELCPQCLGKRRLKVALDLRRIAKAKLRQAYNSIAGGAR